jgi:predicted permease
MDALNEHGRGTSSDRRLSLSNSLVVAQVALSLVIVVAAGLFVRTFEKLATLPLGFDSDRVLLVNANLTRTHVRAGDRISFVSRLAGEIARVPGVAGAAGSYITPVLGASIVETVRLPGAPQSFESVNIGQLTTRGTYANFITPGWFETYGTPIKVGRDFDERDTKEAQPVMIVNEAFVRKFLPGRSPLGQTVEFERGPRVQTIVGVVGNAAYGSLRNDTSPTEYVPLAQGDFGGQAPGDLSLSIRVSGGSPMVMARSVSAALLAVDNELVFSFRPMTDQVNASLTQERVVAMLAGFLGALALLLAGLGLYGVTAYAVNRRRIEIGIRMALGADQGSVVRMVLWRVTLLVGIGILIGAGISVWASRSVAALLYGLEPRDPVTLVAAAVILGSVGAAAGWLPAYRAARIDPAEMLRDS